MRQTARPRGCCWFCFSVCRCLFSLIIISPPAMSPPPILSLSPPALHLLPAPLFAAAQLLDVTIFDRFRRAAWWLPPLASSMPSSLLDTALFFFLAFAYTDVPWLSLAIGDFCRQSGDGAFVVAVIPVYRLALGGIMSDPPFCTEADAAKTSGARLEKCFALIVRLCLNRFQCRIQRGI